MQKAVTVSPKQLIADFDRFTFKAAEDFYWSAETNTVHYILEALELEAGVYRLLHEIGHAVSDHKTFASGVELLRLETEAWARAKDIADNYDLVIPGEHIDACLHSYRDWLHNRSTCPACKNTSAEIDENTYRCFNCSQQWTVPADQRSRCYRLKM